MNKSDEIILIDDEHVVPLSLEELIHLQKKGKPIDTDSLNILLENYKQELLNQRLGYQKFIDLVHEHPVASTLTAIFSAILLIPTIIILIAAFSNNTKRLVEDFISKLKLVIRDEKDENTSNYNRFEGPQFSLTVSALPDPLYNLPVNKINNLKIIDKGDIHPIEHSAKHPAKLKVLSLLDNPPKTFLWNKQRLSESLYIKEQDGKSYLILSEDYKMPEVLYHSERESQIRRSMHAFRIFISTILNIPIKEVEKKDDAAGSTLGDRGVTYTCQISAEAINNAEINPEALQNFYKACDVLDILEKTVQHWAEQVDDCHNIKKDLAESIINSLAIVSNKAGGFNINYTYEMTLISNNIKENNSRLETYQNLINNLNDYLDEVIGKANFDLNVMFETLDCDDDCIQTYQKVKLTVLQEKFEAIVEKNVDINQKPTHFGAVFPPEKDTAKPSTPLEDTIHQGMENK